MVNPKKKQIEDNEHIEEPPADLLVPDHEDEIPHHDPYDEDSGLDEDLHLNNLHDDLFGEEKPGRPDHHFTNPEDPSF